MFLELIGTFVAGIAAAGVVLLLNMLTGGRLPKWAMPVTAGVARIGVTVANEYSWGTRTADGLPEGVVVIDDIQTSSWYKPWTYVWPQTVRLTALDTQGVQSREDVPDVKLVDLYLFARWQPPARVPQLLHCADAKRADVTDAALENPAQAVWSTADPAMLEKICGGTSDA